MSVVADGANRQRADEQHVPSLTGSFGSVQPARAASMTEDASNAKILKEIVLMSCPLGLAAVAQYSIGAVLTAMVGNMVGVEELGAASLAFGLINATAFSFAAGFCGALETMLSQSYGRNPKSKIYGVYAQRMTLMLLLIAFGLGPILAFSDVMLEWIGQNPVVARLTGEFCRACLFGVFPAMILELLRRYFACQHLNYPLSINLVAGAALFPFVLWCLISIFGFLGASLSWVVLMLAMPGSLLVYLIYSGKLKKTWGGWNEQALHDWTPMLKLAFPSMAMMLSEWVSLEINCVTAGYASPTELAAFSIVYQTSGMLWGLASGVFITSAVLVGNALGQGRNALARRCAFLSLGVTLVVALMNVTFTVVFRRQIARVFSNDEDVIAEFPKLIRFFAVYHIFDAIQSCMMGILRGCGLQTIGAVCIALVYSVVGVPLGITLFFKTSMGVSALWLGPAVGVTCVGFPMYCYLFFWYIPWDTLCSKEDPHHQVATGVTVMNHPEDGVTVTSVVEDRESVCTSDSETRWSFSNNPLSVEPPHHVPQGSYLHEWLRETACFQIPQRTLLLTSTHYSTAVSSNAPHSYGHLHATSVRSGPTSGRISPHSHHQRTHEGADSDSTRSPSHTQHSLPGGAHTVVPALLFRAHSAPGDMNDDGK